jgi:glutathione S-transferase
MVTQYALRMTVTIYYHPYSRAANVVWMLEELGLDHELRFVDLLKGAHKAPEIVALNPMGKLPILTDDNLVVTESAAIGLYLADRYAPGRLAPALDDPRRGTYLRWALFAPSVIEPGVGAKQGGWATKESQVGWGNYDAMLRAFDVAIGNGPYLLGDMFSMADVIFGGTLRFMRMVKAFEPSPTVVAYTDRLGERPGAKRADARNAALAKEHGLGK